MKATRILCLLGALVFVASAGAQAQKASVTVPFFGNKSCPISGEKIDKKRYVVHNGDRIYTCCRKCVKKIKADPAKWHAKAYPAAKVVDLKNETCPVMGKPAKAEVAVDFQGRRIHFCCKKCAKHFKQEPRKGLALMTTKGLKAVGNKRCAVMHEEEVKKDSFLVYKNNLVSICCPGCVEDFAKEPERFLADAKKLAKAGKEHRGKEHGDKKHDGKEHRGRGHDGR